MNRREFVQAAALFLAGSACAGVPVCSCERVSRFRAQKVFLESWDAEDVRNNSPQTLSWMRKKLECAQHKNCDALILIPRGGSPSGRNPARWMDKIVPEADFFNVKIFVPACLTRDFFDPVCTIRPLSHEKGFLQCTDGKPADNGGFLLLDRRQEAYGLVLYDSSHCLWSGFASPAADLKQDAGFCESDSRLFSARWLDRALLSQ